MLWTSGPSESNHRLPGKTGTKVTTPVAEEARESRNLLSRYLRVYGEGIHVPVGDISQIEG